MKIRQSQKVRCPIHGETMGAIVSDSISGDRHEECGICGFAFDFRHGYRRSQRK